VTVIGKEPSVAAIPAVIKINKREKRINMIFRPINFLYCAFIAVPLSVPAEVSVLDVMRIHVSMYDKYSIFLFMLFVIKKSVIK